MLHDDSDELNASISNERKCMLHDYYDEGIKKI